MVLLRKVLLVGLWVFVWVCGFAQDDYYQDDDGEVTYYEADNNGNPKTCFDKNGKPKKCDNLPPVNVPIDNPLGLVLLFAGAAIGFFCLHKQRVKNC